MKGGALFQMIGDSYINLSDEKETIKLIFKKETNE
jgi:hypothetical protein